MLLGVRVCRWCMMSKQHRGLVSIMCKQVRQRIRGRLTRQQEAHGQMAAPAAPVKGGRKSGAAGQDAGGVTQAANGTGRSGGQDPEVPQPDTSPATGGKRKAAAMTAQPGSPNKRKQAAGDTQHAAQPAVVEGQSKGSKAARRPAGSAAAAGAAAAAAGGGSTQPQEAAELDSDSDADELLPRAAGEQRSFLEEVRLCLPPRVECPTESRPPAKPHAQLPGCSINWCAAHTQWLAQH
jgi:hypothetical protein